MLYKIVRPFIKFIFKTLYRPRIVGSEFIPRTGSAILAGNHTNNFDCLLLMSATTRIVHFLGKHTLFAGIKRPIMKAMKVIPVDRTKSKNPEALKQAKEVLTRGDIIGIFPEGTINRTEQTIMPFKMGAVYLSKCTNSIVVPFTITGTYRPFKNDLQLTFFPPYIASSADLEKENIRLMNTIREHLERN